MDHLIVAGPDLEEATEYVESVLGLHASAGGRHPGVGTRNALVGLGPGAYIEIIGPDPEQAEPELPRWFGIDTLTGPRLATWSARTGDLARAVADGRAVGLELGTIARGGRVRPDGTRLEWRVTDPRAERFHGVLPFLMDWGESEHPSSRLGAECALVRLRGFHPDVLGPRVAAEALGLPVELAAGPEPLLEADIRTPAGLVTLR
ncbi:MAG: VOC family protein [Gemmatimonadota bacterium]